MLGKHKKGVLSIALVAGAVLTGAWLLRSQQAPQGKEKHPPGTISARLEDSKGDVRLTLTAMLPPFQSLDTLADSSDAVVRGRVLGARSYPCNKMQFVCTAFRFNVEQVLFGNIPLERRVSENGAGQSSADSPYPIEITQAGGSLPIEGRRVIASVSDQQMLQPGREYILFLKWVPENGSSSVGWNTYHLHVGTQAAIELEDEEARSLLKDESHPIRFEVDKLQRNSRSLILSHFEQRRLGRRP